MFSNLRSIFRIGPGPIGTCGRQWRLGTRTLGGWAALAFARLKELAPYALIELLLPGGSVVALTLWFYRRRRKVPGLAKSLNALL
jgi:hypothetical protein